MSDRVEDWLNDPEEPDEIDAMEHALQQCGQTEAGGCQLAGTEYCDFDCPFRDVNLFVDEPASEEGGPGDG